MTVKQIATTGNKISLFNASENLIQIACMGGIGIFDTTSGSVFLSEDN